MKRTLLIMMALVMLITPQVYAGFLGTEWGMTEEQVIAIMGKPFAGCGWAFGEKIFKPRPGRTDFMAYDAKVFGYPCMVECDFLDKKLVCISLFIATKRKGLTIDQIEIREAKILKDMKARFTRSYGAPKLLRVSKRGFRPLLWRVYSSEDGKIALYWDPALGVHIIANLDGYLEREKISDKEFSFEPRVYEWINKQK